MDRVLDNVEQLTIVGVGLIGATVGLTLKQAGYGGRIVGVGWRIETVERARARGCVDEATTDLAAAVSGSQLLIIAVPLGTFEAIFEQLAPCAHEQLVITDAGSTKSDVCAAARKHLPNPRRFVGAHPMAGSEQKGPEAARADLLQGKPCIITADDDTDPDALAMVESLWTALGMRLIHMSAEQHDEQTAVISHLPHATAVLLVQVAAKLGGLELASTGFRDTTRLASSNPPMRADIVMANREHLHKALNAFRTQIDEFDEHLQRGDHDKILQWLSTAKQARDQWLETRS